MPILKSDLHTERMNAIAMIACRFSSSASLSLSLFSHNVRDVSLVGPLIQNETVLTAHFTKVPMQFIHFYILMK